MNLLEDNVVYDDNHVFGDGLETRDIIIMGWQFTVEILGRRYSGRLGFGS